MDVNVEHITLTEDGCTIAASLVLCGVCTIVYLLCDFVEHQPLFYIFLWLSCSGLIVEFGEQFATKVFGSNAIVTSRSIIQSSTFGICRCLDSLIQLRREQKTTFFWVLICFFIALFCLTRQMDDASLVYAACMLLSSSPLIRKLLGESTRELANRASRLFQPPVSEPAELASFLPHVNEVSRDFSIRTRRSSGSLENSVIEPELNISALDDIALRSLEASMISSINESRFLPLLEQSMESLRSSKATDDDTSPIPSDVEIIEADDIPEDFAEYSDFKNGRGILLQGEFTSTGTLKRTRKDSEED